MIAFNGEPVTDRCASTVYSWLERLPLIHLRREAANFPLRQRRRAGGRTAPLARRAGRIGPCGGSTILLLCGAQTLQRILH